MIKKTQPHNQLWAASLRYFCAPHRIIIDERLTVAAWEALVETVVVKNMKSWAVPGELVGIIAAQSIGEPTTQLTLNEYALRTGRRHISSSMSYMEKRCKYYNGLF
jgi:hypothetical protein